MMDLNHHELLAKVAAMYYEQEMTQNEIAASLDLSRVKIYRLLKEARESQIVRILIDWPSKRAIDLESRAVARVWLGSGSGATNQCHRIRLAAAPNRTNVCSLSGRGIG